MEMKCVKKDKNIKRVSDQKAHDMVDNHGWEFIPKEEWKKKVRDKSKNKKK
jgi:hypothetical protein